MGWVKLDKWCEANGFKHVGCIGSHNIVCSISQSLPTDSILNIM